MPILLQAGENLYISAYSFHTVIQPVGTDPNADGQELFLTIKNPPKRRTCARRGITPARIKPANVEVRGPRIAKGTTPSRVKPASVGGRAPALRPGTTPRRIKPSNTGDCE